MEKTLKTKTKTRFTVMNMVLVPHSPPVRNTYIKMVPTMVMMYMKAVEPSRSPAQTRDWVSSYLATQLSFQLWAKSTRRTSWMRMKRPAPKRATHPYGMKKEFGMKKEAKVMRSMNRNLKNHQPS
jgi:hypothetical protein